MKTKNKTAAAFARLDALSHLKPGWLDGEGQVVSEDALQAARYIFTMFKDLDPLVGIFPQVEGGISIESNGAPYFYFDIEPDGRVEVADMTLSEQEPDVMVLGPLTGDWGPKREFNRRVYKMIEDSNLHRKALIAGYTGPQGREARLDGLLRSILPSINLAVLPDSTREKVLREYVELRASHSSHPREIPFEVTEELFYYDEILMAEIASDVGAGLLMRVEEAEAGYPYVLAIPQLHHMEKLRAGDVDVRKVMLDGSCLIYTASALSYEDGVTKGVMTEMRGYLAEPFLPEDGFFLIDKPAVSDTEAVEGSVEATL